ncbi:hypothetical protein EC973_003616 [Apophysomyces ossiformis]|uniref:ENTH domain-containing protein n=1 Tax=Apophysomyces ossiformis TaxID=679940 RepID=A0A8H7BT13_9FUNG|nr:hypothetical protein EC973_003616 [Apophysomyces ossiformis]
MTGKGVVRSIKNYAKGFSDVQIKVREATSNDAWGPSGTLMNEIAQLTYNQHDFVEIMDMIDRRLNDKGKNWRHVFKALLLLDYCLHVGSENVVLYAKENIYVVKTLKEFQHLDDNGTDVGANVRQKAKDITNLLMDDARLREERQQRQHMRDRMIGVTDYMNDSMVARDRDVYTAPGHLDEDRDLRRALQESKRLAEEEARNREQGDEDLARAIQLSEQEAKERERKEKERLERENAQNLFGGTDSFNPFPANQAFDSNTNPYSQQLQWPQNTGMTNLSFSDPISANQQRQPSFYNSNPYQQNNPYQQYAAFPNALQAQMTGIPQQTQFTGMAPFQPSTMTGFTQQPQSAGALTFQSSMPTGNNPFGLAAAQQQQTQPAGAIDSSSFRQQPLSVDTRSYFSSPSLTQQAIGSPVRSSPQQTDPRYARLNSLLANKEDGMDTFGNTGNLRIPVGTGFASSMQPQNKNQSANGKLNDNTADLLNLGTSDRPSFSQAFQQQPSRNPFGQPNPLSPSQASSNQQKSLLELMQEQKQQQLTQQPQITGLQLPQSTGVNGSMAFTPQQYMASMVPPQATGFNGPFGQQQAQQAQAQAQQQPVEWYIHVRHFVMLKEEDQTSYETEVESIQSNIQQHKRKLFPPSVKQHVRSELGHTEISLAVSKKTDSKKKTKKPEGKEELQQEYDKLVRCLDAEYTKLRSTRLKYGRIFGDLFKQQQAALRKERAADIRARQSEFVEALKKEDDLIRQRWSENEKTLNGVEVCDRLLTELGRLIKSPNKDSAIEVVYASDEEEDEEEDEEDEAFQMVDTTVLIIPLSVMELFWDIEVQVPVRLSEVEPTMIRIRERRDNLAANKN